MVIPQRAFIIIIMSALLNFIETLGKDKQNYDKNKNVL